MTAFTLKNIPEDLYERIKRSAKKNRRSINSEILFRIEKSMSEEYSDAGQVIRQARQLRELTRYSPPRSVDINEAKKSGRA